MNRETIPCLFDTNAIIKYYHDVELGADIIKYLFDDSPTTQMNITNLHIPEVVSVFHLLRVRNLISDEGRDKAIDTFLKDILEKPILPSPRKLKYFQFLGGCLSLNTLLTPLM